MARPHHHALSPCSFTLFRSIPRRSRQSPSVNGSCVHLTANAGFQCVNITPADVLLASWREDSIFSARLIRSRAALIKGQWCAEAKQERN
jgi:hypothetical protein